MKLLHKSLLAAGLSSMALVIGFSQSSAKAQSNALQELAREMIGSSFEKTDAPTALPGSPSMVDGGRGRLGSVMTNLIDDEIRRRSIPVIPQDLSQDGPKTVQLLVPIKTGLEFKNIQAIIPQVKILETLAKVYVFVTESPRALPAYELGRQLQTKLGVTFELAYSKGHPDQDLAWMGPNNGDVATAPKIVDPFAKSNERQTASTLISKSPVQPQLPGTAEDLQGLTIQSPWLASSQPSPLSQTKLVSDPSPKPVKEMSSLHANLALQPLPPIQELNAKIATAPQPIEPKRSSVIKSVDVAEQAQHSKSDKVKSSPSSIHDSLIELASMRVSLAKSRSAGTAIQQTSIAGKLQSYDQIFDTNVQSSRSKSLVKAVAIQPTGLGNIPLVSSRFMGTNKSLAYVYVKLDDTNQINALKKVSNIAMAHHRDGKLLARVGIYTNSRVGQRLQKTQIQKLSQAGFEIELIASHASVNNQQSA